MAAARTAAATALKRTIEVERPREDPLDQTIEEAAAWLASWRRDDGHWVFELEADATIPSEYILLNHFLDEIDDRIEHKVAAYLRRIQGADGGWPLYHDGEANLSATVKAYFALKLVGDDPAAPHMCRAREVVLAGGGAARANVFCRYALALFGQIPWRGVPWMPVEAVLLPKRAPFNLDKVSYWSRTTMVPLLLLASLRPRARNPRNVDVRELFTVPPEQHLRYQTNPTGSLIGDGLLVFDAVARVAEPFLPGPLKKLATEQALSFIRERLNGEDGLGAIFPPMAGALMVFDTLGYPRDHPDRQIVRRAVDKLLVVKEDEAYLQPCLSPVWDTSLAVHAMMEAGHAGDADPVVSSCSWLKERQILDVVGDWGSNRGHIRPGGWAFQYRNDHYPDVDDTAVVAMALHRADADTYRHSIDRAAEWIVGMQSGNGGWGAFDADNEHYFLNNIPFADHGALLDPPTADVTARCIGFLGQLGYPADHPTVARALDFLKREQEKDGSWFGRWGTNYIYGTWSVLTALNAVGEDMNAAYVRRAVGWLKSRQRDDGGWGEDCASYWPERRAEVKASTPSQTAWALLGLMAAGEVNSAAVGRGVDFLLTAPRAGGKWREDHYNAVGFPKVFYLRYHGYSAYFPLWALARYRNLRHSNLKRPAYGL
jgi:squalene-hopene/tetraprenyl-beta-curcumene cyclase